MPATTRSFGGCHSIQLSYGRVGAGFAAVSAASPKDWKAWLGEGIGGGDRYCSRIEFIRVRTCASDAVVSMRVRRIRSRRRERSRVRRKHGIRARNHSLQLADRSVPPDASGFASAPRSCRRRRHTSEAAAVTAVVRRWRHVCQSPKNRKSSNFVALSGYGMRSETPYTGTE